MIHFLFSLYCIPEEYNMNIFVYFKENYNTTGLYVDNHWLVFFPTANKTIYEGIHDVEVSYD